MIDCQILSLEHGATTFPMPPIIHHRLKTLSLCSAKEWGLVPVLLDSLTLPCLHELDIDEAILLTHLTALVHRSSCPLTRLTLSLKFREDFPFLDMQPLPGVVDLVVEALNKEQAFLINKLLLEGYFPNLQHLTLRLQAFLYLWDMNIIPLLLDRKRREYQFVIGFSPCALSSCSPLEAESRDIGNPIRKPSARHT